MKRPNRAGPSGRPFPFTEWKHGENTTERRRARQALLVAAEQFVNVHRGAAVVIVRGEVDVIRRTLGARPAKPDPGELRGYELRIIQALTHTPVGHRCLARAAGLTQTTTSEASCPYWWRQGASGGRAGLLSFLAFTVASLV